MRRIDNAPVDARDRILETAYDLFSRHGTLAVGVDRIVAEAGVAKMTLYRHFPSKDDLVIAFLQRRRERWAGWLRSEAERLAPDVRDRPAALFEALDGWFQRDDYEGCAIANTLIEVHGSNDRVHRSAAAELDVIRGMIQAMASEAGLERPAEAARQLQLLMLGAIVSASRGDRMAARRAAQLAKPLLGP